MKRFRIGTAPVSWGVAGPEYPRLPAERVLAEMAEAGYEGTELGPWGYLPHDPAQLRSLLERHGLALASAFCPVNLHGPALDRRELAELKTEAELLATLGARDIIISDMGTPHRQAISGRVKAEADGDALDAAGWRRVREFMKQICAISAPLGLQVCYHQHVGTYVETDEEIAALVEAIEGLPVGLCLDTGHLAYAGADPVTVFRTYADQISFCHLKDFSRSVLERCMADGLTFNETVRTGVFVPLGQGDVDYASIFNDLRRAEYSGWLIVEQDRFVAGETDTLGSARLSREFLRTMLGD